MIQITNEQLDKLIDQASPEVQTLIAGDDIGRTVAILGKVYGLPISSYILFENIITLTLLGAIAPINVVQAIIHDLQLSEERAFKMAEDLEKSIFEKARIVILGKPATDLVTLRFEGEGDKEELRKKIMDTTKRDSGFTKNQSTGAGKKGLIITPGSRSQLLEQLQVLDAIPDDDEVAARLHHIREQIQALEDKKVGEGLQITPEDDALIFGKKGTDPVDPVPKAASYSRAPTKYNVDPYREISDI